MNFFSPSRLKSPGVELEPKCRGTPYYLPLLNLYDDSESHKSNHLALENTRGIAQRLASFPPLPTSLNPGDFASDPCKDVALVGLLLLRFLLYKQLACTLFLFICFRHAQHHASAAIFSNCGRRGSDKVQRLTQVWWALLCHPPPNLSPVPFHHGDVSEAPRITDKAKTFF